MFRNEHQAAGSPALQRFSEVRTSVTINIISYPVLINLGRETSFDAHNNYKDVAYINLGYNSLLYKVFNYHTKINHTFVFV